MYFYVMIQSITIIEWTSIEVDVFMYTTHVNLIII